MELELKERFLTLWEKYFSDAPLPVVFFYSDKTHKAQRVKPPKSGHRCVLADIFKAIRGKSVFFEEGSFGCFGGKKYLGYGDGFMPDFEYFLSCGIPGKLEGERYKKTPELVKAYMKSVPAFMAPFKNIVFKRWDLLDDEDNPEVVIFFGTPDIISGLFTLSNFDREDLNGVIAPFGAGCATITLYPYLEKKNKNPRAIMGMFDVSARPCISPHMFTIALPMKRVAELIGNMDESFLITSSWKKVKNRISKEIKNIKK